MIMIMVAAASAAANANLIQVDMHPSTWYILWLLHQQQSIIDGDDNNSSHRRRRLEIIEEQLQWAMEQIEGTSAVYAPFFEFPLLDDAIRNNDNHHHDNVDYDYDDGHNHRRLVKQFLQRHNDAVQEYNERYRQFSRYERALQNEQLSSSFFDKMNTTITTATATTASRLDTPSSILSSLNGTKWQATELFIASNNNNKATNNYQLQAPLANHHPITLEFDAINDSNNEQPLNYIFSGSISGCNRYIGSIYQTIDTTTLDNSFYIGDIVATTANRTGTTDAKCTIVVAKSVIEQEQSYMKLLSNGQIYVEVVMNNNAIADELVFWKYDSVEVKNEDVLLQKEDELAYYHRHGQILARFKPLSDSLLKDNDQSSTSSSVHRRRTIRQRSLQETVTSKKKGGMFNSYQTSPLHQGYGTHYATIWVGTPPQRKSVIIDTGSHFTAFPCKGCLGCGEEHHTDKYFDQDASSTFRPLHCKAVPNRPKECQGIANCLNGKCILSQTYTEGSSWEAFQAVDKLFVGGKQLTNTALKSDSYGKRKR